jgi:hypothetical protein
MKNRSTLVLTGFLVAVVVVFGTGYLIGDRAPAIAHGDEVDAAGSAGHGDPMTDMAGAGQQDGGHPADALPPGLAVSQQGYTLQLASPSVVEVGRTDLRFSIAGPDGQPVADYQRRHEKDLHLIVVSRDLATFRHVHPQLDADGVWSVPVDLDRPGDWRLYADFAPQELGEGLVLATDITAVGDVAPQALPPAADSAEVDGYRVSLAGRAEPGNETELVFTVSRAGQPVNDLAPYLGADGHLVALRVGDLAYLHTHPQGHEPTGGPQIRFAATFPTAGSYRVFLDFEHAGRVHTAAFTMIADRH